MIAAGLLWRGARIAIAEVPLPRPGLGASQGYPQAAPGVRNSAAREAGGQAQVFTGPSPLRASPGAWWSARQLSG